MQFYGFANFAKSGTSTWTLSGAGDASRNWTITDGTLVGDTTSLLGNVVLSPVSSTASPTLEFDQTSNGTYAGVVSGSGDMLKTGSGTLVLTGTNTYTGGTTITSGTLQLGDGGTTGSIVGDVTDNGTLAFDRSDAVTYSHVISGSGALVKLGSGTLILDGVNTYTGSTTVSAGTLEVGDASHTTASVAGDVTVNADGTLRGHGTVHGNVSNDGGVVMPGGSIGVLTVAGNYVQSATGTLNLEISPNTTAGTGYSQLQVGGTATLDGALVVSLDTGTYLANTSYDLVHAAGGVSGTFSTTTLTPALAPYLTSTVSYSADDVMLKLSPNPAAYASAFPDYASNVSMGVEQSFDAVLGHMNPQAEGRNGAWGQYLASWGGLGQGSRYAQNGGAAGVGRSVSDDLVLGVAVSGGTTTTTLSPMQVQAKPLGGFVYGIWREGGLRLAGSFGLGHLQEHSTRYLNGLGIQDASSTGRYDGFALRGDYTAKVGAV